MATNYQQPGEVIPWTNGTGAAVESGQVVKVGHLLGVAAVDIPNAGVGSVYIDGVFVVPKVSASVIAQGEKVLWDVSAGAFAHAGATPATGDVSNAAIAVEAAGNGATSLAVKLNVAPGTVT